MPFLQNFLIYACYIPRPLVLQ
uniref:Uncharacterized protein n=1 Tax=Anguilla anguilla TaxID=7936 RepID=A0A0E9TQM5_ANGAN